MGRREGGVGGKEGLELHNSTYRLNLCAHKYAGAILLLFSHAFHICRYRGAYNNLSLLTRPGA